MKKREGIYTESITVKISSELKVNIKKIVGGRNISEFIRETLEKKVKKEKFKRYKGLLEKDMEDMNIIEAMEKKRLLEIEIKELDLLIEKLTQKETMKILKERMDRIKRLVVGN